MCRWFAYIAPDEDCLLEDVLITPKHSISRQVHDHYLPKLFSHDPNNITTAHEIAARNRLFNTDGLGVCWYTSSKSDFESSVTGPRPAVYKTTATPLADPNFRSISANTATLTCLAHIRASSAAPTVSVNNHPFIFGRHSFMHNGFISSFQRIKRELIALLDADAYAAIQGATDSEHLAALYMTLLTSGAGASSWERTYPPTQMASALKQAIGKVIQLQQKILGDEAEPNDLNLCATDGACLVAVRARNHATEQPPSLYVSDSAGVTLNRKYPDHPDGPEHHEAAAAAAAAAGGQRNEKKREEHGRHVIVASEPTTYREREWRLVGKNQLVVVREDGGWEFADLEMPAEWDAVVN